MNEADDAIGDAERTLTTILKQVESAVVVDRDVLRELLAAVVAKGHVLDEDVPLRDDGGE